MGLFRGQAIDVIDYKSDDKDILVHKYTKANDEIKIGAQLTVRPGQAAVFVKSGKIADVFEEGRHTLTTANLPILSNLVNLPFGGNTPFKADVYFINTTKQTDNKWGTTEPVAIRDKEFGSLRIRARGSFIYQITEPARFIKEVVGSIEENYYKKDLNKTLKTYLLTTFTDLVASSQVPFLDLATQYDELSAVLTSKIEERTSEEFFVTYTDVLIENITLPEAVLEALDTRSSMNIIGNMGQYTQYQAATAVREAANNPGEAGGTAGLGAGMAMGQMMFNNVNNAYAGGNQQPQGVKVRCTGCGALLDESDKFCGECGQKQGPAACKNCGSPLDAGSKFCGECGTKV